MKKSKLAIRNRMLAFVLSIAMVLSFGDYSGLMFAHADSNYSFSLTYSKMTKLINPVSRPDGWTAGTADETSSFSAYSGNKTSTVLSNSSNTSLDVYMDVFSRLYFNLDTTSTSYRIYLKKAQADITSLSGDSIEVKNGVVSNGLNSDTVGKMTIELLGNQLIVSNVEEEAYTYYIYIQDLTNGSYTTEIKFHVMFKFDKDALLAKNEDIVFALSNDGATLRQGKNMTIEFPYNTTDGFDWSVVNLDEDGEPTGDANDDIKATVNTNGTGNSKHDRERSVDFSAKSDKGTGWVRVTAKTTSGIDNENADGKLIALMNRGETVSSRIFITEWIKATELYFNNYDDGTTGKGDNSVTYNFLVGENVTLTELLKTFSDKIDASTGEYRTPNDDITFTSSDTNVAGIGSGVAKFKKKGQITITAQAEDPAVSDICNIYVRQETETLKIYSKGVQTTTMSLRPGNSVEITVKEDSGADEELVWNEEIFGDYLDCELITDSGDTKVYRFTTKAYNSTESKDINLTVRTNRSSISEDTTAYNVSASLKFTLNPSVEDDSTIQTLVQYDGENGDGTNSDEINLYNGEKITIRGSVYDSEGNKYNPADQIKWDAYENAAYIDKSDYPNNDYSATTITSNGTDGDSKVRVTALSNENATKDITIHNKTKISEAVLSLEGETHPTISVGDTYTLYTAITPSNADETLYYETSDEGHYINLNSETGELTAVAKTGSSPVNVKVYAYHSHGVGFDDGFSQKRLVGEINISILDAGSMSLNPSHKSIYYDADTYTISPTINDVGEGTTYSIDDVVINWSIANDGETFVKKVAELEKEKGSSNTVNPLLVGKAVISASFGQGENTISADSTVTVKASLDDVKINVEGINTELTEQDDTSYIYLPNGESYDIVPVISSVGIDSRASATEGTYVLEEDTDYTTVDSHTDGAGIGVYKYTINGGSNGLYTGSRALRYKVWPKDLSGYGDDAEISVNLNEELVFNGKAQKPDLEITYTKGENSEVLQLGTDYILGDGATNAGEHQITITGRGNFTGSFNYTYTINKFDIDEMFDVERVSLSNNIVIVQTIDDQVFNGTEVEPTIKLYTRLVEGNTTWTTLTKDDSYTVEYSNNTGVGTGKVTITGQGNYKGSVEIDFEIYAKDFSNDKDGGGSTVIAKIANQTYTGSEIEPELTVTANGVELTKGVDYEVEYSNNVDSRVVSKDYAYATITGIGNYTGEKTATFQIVQADLKDVTIADIPDQYYCNTKITPEIMVSLGDYELVENKDYTLLYGANDPSSTLNYQNEGIVTITTVSNSNFTATEKTAVRQIYGKEASFNIVEKSITKQADDIKITQEDGSELINGKIYVNKSGVDNSELKFYIEAVNNDETESDDIVFATALTGQSQYSCEVVNLDATVGNRAVITVKGLSKGTSKITLATQKGYSKEVEVVVNSPATKIGTTVYDTYNKKYVTPSNQIYPVYYNHEYQMKTSFTPSDSTDTVTWSVNDDSIATITKDGLLTTTKTGTVKVTVTTDPSEVYPGGVSNTIALFVSKNGYAQEVSIDNPDAHVRYGGSVSLNGTATADYEITETLEWTSSDETIAKIASGKEEARATFNGLKVGKSNITYGSKEEDGVRADGLVTVYEPLSSNYVTVSDIFTNLSTREDDSYVYRPNGASLDITPVLTSNGIDSRSDETGSYTLVPDSDYVATDSHKDGDGIGTYQYTFSGGENELYTDSRTASYRVWPKDITNVSEDTELSVSLKEELVFNGKVQKPNIEITYSQGENSEVLEEGTDYTLGTGATDAGTYNITVTGEGNFIGSFDYEYKINKYDIKSMFDAKRVSLSNDSVAVRNIDAQTFNGKEVEPAVKLYVRLLEDSTTWTTLSSDSYTVSYSNNDSIGTGKVTIEGQGNYEGKVEIEFTILAKDFSDDRDGGGSTVIAKIADQTYTGSKIKPELSVTANGVELSKGTDYEVSYSNNLNSRTVSNSYSTATIKGIGNYTGEKSASFQIVQADLKDVTIEEIPDQYYCNTKITPEIKVTLGDYTLIEGTDYTVLYGSSDSSSSLNYQNEGVVTIVPVSGSNFKATEKTSVRGVYGKEVSFNIVDKKISKTADDIKITCSDGSELKDGKIYVNKTGLENSTLAFNIEAVNSDGSPCEDIVFTNALTGQSYYSCEVVNIDATVGNKAVVIITGKNPGKTKIRLATLNGYTKDIEVVVNSPATAIGTTVYDTYNKKNVTASNQTYTVYYNHEYQLSANFTPSNSTDTVSWSVNNGKIATIDKDGLLKTLGTGTVKVTVTTNASEVYPGGVSNTISLFVSSNGYAETVEIDNTDAHVQYGSTINLNGSATSESGDITEVLEWVLEKDNIASITSGKESAKATFKGLKVGKTKVTYGSKEADKVRAEGLITVNSPLNSSNVTISNIYTNTSTETDESYTYLPNGVSLGIEPVLTSSGIDSRAGEDGSYTLVKDTDYVEADSHQDGNGVGTYTYTFTGGENELYTGSVTASYKVWPKSIANIDSDEELTVESLSDLTFNGKVQQPELEITYTNGNNSEVLVLGKDYTLGTGSTAAGDHEITVTGKGNFTGSFTYEYTIDAFDIDSMFDAGRISLSSATEAVQTIADQVFNGAQVEPKVNLYARLIEDNTAWTTLSSTDSFDVTYSNNDSVGTGKATITGKGNYKGTVEIEFEIAAKDLSNDRDGGGSTVIAKIADQTYTGSKITPELTVTANGVELKAGTDYKATYSNNLDSKTVSKDNATVTIKGIGNYTGEKSATFVILQADLSEATISDIPDQYYVSSLITPEITVALGDYELIKGTDYEVFYGDNNQTTAYNYNKGEDAGVVTITPVANSNFKASAKTEVRGVNGKEARFNIVQKEITKQADDVTIKNIDGTALSDGNIYVNKKGVENNTLEFIIEAVNNDETACDDVVFATSTDSNYFTYKVVNTDATVGNKAIVTITGVSQGIATLTLNTQKGFSKRINVVVNSPATDIKINMFEDPEDSKTKISEVNGSYMAYEKHEYYLTPSFTPSDSNDTVSWSVSDDALASITKDGKLTLKKAGTVEVTATTNSSEVYAGGVKKTITVVIQNNIAVTEAEIKSNDEAVVIKDNAINLEYGKTTRLSGTAKSSEGEVTEKLVWSSSDESVIQITEGSETGLVTIKAVGPGSATIFYGSAMEDGVKGELTVNVVVPVTSISLDRNEASVMQENTIKLTATLNEYAVDGFVWEVSNVFCAEILDADEDEVANSQTVTIKGIKGDRTVDITVYAKSDKKLSSACKITITVNPELVTPTPVPVVTEEPVATETPTAAPDESAAPEDSAEPSAEPTAAPGGSDSDVTPEPQGGDGTSTAAPDSSANPTGTAAPSGSDGSSATATPAPTASADASGSTSTQGGSTADSSVPTSRIVSAKNLKGRRLNVSLSKADGVRYQLWYSTSKNFKKGRKIRTSAKNVIALKRLAKGRIYYLKVRTFKVVDGQKVYSEFSGVRRVKIKR